LRQAVLVNALSPHPWLFWATVGGPLLVEAGDESAALAVAFLAGFYAMLVGAKVGMAGLVEIGRRRGTSRLLPRSVTARLGSASVVQRFGGLRIVSAILLAAAAAALLVDAASRL
jgi:threonine/homoserine/homoserine lactone efflux protein